MPERRFKVSVYTTKGESLPAKEDQGLAFNIMAGTVDKATTAVRERLNARGHTVLSVRHAPGERVVAVVVVGQKPERPTFTHRIVGPTRKGARA